MKKRILKAIPIILIIVVGIIIGLNINIDDVYEDEEIIPEKITKNLISMMIEQTAGTGDYKLETRSSWPTQEEGYVFNKKLSKCENGSKLKWDTESNVVIFEGTSIDKCHVYFDVYIDLPYHERCSDNSLGCYVAKLYTGTQGENSIYYHDETLENSAGDESYRYSGTDPNNYVCFGSSATSCPNDSLYRIIGVFDEKVKLIKYDYATYTMLGTDGDYNSACSSNSNCNSGTSKGTNSKGSIGAYYWNYNNSTESYNKTNVYSSWNYSMLNTINLNKNFINYIGSDWVNKIDTAVWTVGGNSFQNVENSAPPAVYTNEITNPSDEVTKTYGAKIGLMYASDYGFAASPSAWTTNLSSYNSSDITSVNWLYMGLHEWTISRSSVFNDRAYRVSTTGNINTDVITNADSAIGIRPVFYLKSSVLLDSGTGAKKTPYLLK